MNNLHALQQQFTAYVFDHADAEALFADITPNGFSAQQRLNVYRNNTRLGLTEALKANFPVVEKLVGEAFFKALAAAFIQKYPPATGCLQEYGRDFAHFIANFPPARPLPYLADVARLEWLWQEAYHEADQGKMMLNRLTAIPQTRHADLCLCSHPSLRLLVSSYPIHRIWMLNQDGSDHCETIDLGLGGDKLLVFRPEQDVEVDALTDSDFLWLSLLHSGHTLVSAAEQVYQLDPYFDVSAHLLYWLEAGLFTDFYLRHD